MPLIRPRLNDFHNLPFAQDDVDFAIPFLDEDIPFALDPFLLWKSPSLQDNSLHTVVTNSFNHFGFLVNKGMEKTAVERLIRVSECDEVGLGLSRTRIGKRIGGKLATDVLSLFRDIPQISKSGFVHFEEIQLMVDNISTDRVSDIACSFIKSFLIDYTIDQCERHDIPTHNVEVEVYSYQRHEFVGETVSLPKNPNIDAPVILVPKRWLRRMPWINFKDYFRNFNTGDALGKNGERLSRVSVLNFNRANYGAVQAYTKGKERTQSDCHNDPLFKPLPVLSVSRKLSTLLRLPTGTACKADKKYEDSVCQLMATLMYPELDFAEMQSRTDSGVLIRDLIFYNSRSRSLLRDIHNDYECRQIVMELKNVKELAREHINQLNRYLSDQFGRFGVIVTRNRPPRRIFRNTIDLWAGQRKCILILHDEDLKMMCQLYESRQRQPIDVINKKWVEFIRACPS